jgi:LemA protein
MQTALILLVVILVLILALVVYGVAIYNGLVRLKNRLVNAFAQIDVQLKRRYDLIPNLVETAKGYLKHEREVLEAVIKARNQAASAADRASKSPADPEAISGLMGAEGILSGTLGKLFALVEAYPDLKANQNMMQLSEELTSTENKISFARQAFNDAVMRYNNACQVFPSVIIAGMFRFAPAKPLEVEKPEEREAPRVSF